MRSITMTDLHNRAINCISHNIMTEGALGHAQRVQGTDSDEQVHLSVNASCPFAALTAS